MVSNLINLSINPQTPCKTIPHKTQTPTICSTSISLSQPKVLRTRTLALSSSSSSSSSSVSISKKEGEDVEFGKNAAYDVEFKTMGACKLGISRYPDFEYDARGGGGIGTAQTDSDNGQMMVNFDVSKVYIPPLTSETTKLLGLPLPPPFRIDIEPLLLQGTIFQDSGKVELEFKAKFWFTAGAVYKAPPLLVETVLTTEECEGRMRKGKGQRMDRDGNCKMVGLATVEPIDDAFMNTFLGLPTECLAILNATISVK